MSVEFECKHCRRKLYNERAFMKHECPQMKRASEIQTLDGQRAYVFYKHWLEKQKRKAPAVETFITSAYSTSFIKFSIWANETGIPDPSKYIDLMVEKKIAPALWRRGEAYSIFLEYIDKRSDPYDQATTTVETILSLAEGMGVEPGEVFMKFKSGEILELIQQRRLSPWLLFCSRSFKEWVNTLHEIDRTVLMKGLGIEYWAVKLEKQPAIVKNLKEIAIELGI